MVVSNSRRCSPDSVSANRHDALLATSGRRSRLRTATAEAHARLDDIVDTAGFFRDRDRYAVYLHATLHARNPIEAALGRATVEAPPAGWPHRVIGPALRADIRDVTGFEPPADVVEATLAHTPAQTMGVLYVLEGSALGARVLSKRAAALGMGPEYGARHLAQQISEPAAWPAFLSALEAAILDPEQETACIRAATTAFARFESAYRDAVS